MNHYAYGCYVALVKLGATVLQKELSPAQKSYMQRLTEHGAPVPEGPIPALQKSQRHLGHLARTKLTNLAGSAEDRKIMGYGKLDEKGLAQVRGQRSLVDEWIKSKGSQKGVAPIFRNLGVPEAVHDAATNAGVTQGGTASPVSRAATPFEEAATQFHITPRKPTGISRAVTLARRFAHR
jgi:hypothetical protein